MDAKDRAELERLMDLAEKEQLLQSAPTAVQERAYLDRVLAEQRDLMVNHEREVEAVRLRRKQVASDAEWID